MEKFLFHINGMHCKSCAMLIEQELSKIVGVNSVKASFGHQQVEINGDFGGKSPSEIAEFLTQSIKNHNYSLSVEKQQKTLKLSEFYYAVPIAAVFMALFVLLGKLGIVNLISSSEVNYSTAFLVGIIASLSTCMAVVGGLVLSMSANFAKEGDRFKPQAFFHIGRLVSFFILGGVIGALGSAFQFGQNFTLIIGILVGIIMLLLGLNLLDLFHWTKKLQPTLPNFIGKHIHGLQNLNHTLTPLLVGIATFFLPCGFTQSMQIYSLTTGSFLKGALTMFAFSLGTLPVLSILSFSSYSVNKSPKSGIFFKSAGLIVICFGIFNLINSLSAAGLIPSVFSF